MPVCCFAVCCLGKENIVRGINGVVNVRACFCMQKEKEGRKERKRREKENGKKCQNFCTLIHQRKHSASMFQCMHKTSL